MVRYVPTLIKYMLKPLYVLTVIQIVGVFITYNHTIKQFQLFRQHPRNKWQDVLVKNWSVTNPRSLIMELKMRIKCDAYTGSYRHGIWLQLTPMLQEYINAGTFQTALASHYLACATH